MIGGVMKSGKGKYSLAKGQLAYFLDEKELAKIQYFTIADKNNISRAIMKGGKEVAYGFSLMGISAKKANFDLENAPAVDELRKAHQEKVEQEDKNGNQEFANFIYNASLGCFYVPQKNGEIKYYDLKGDEIKDILLYSIGLNSLITQSPLIITNGIAKERASKNDGFKSLLQAYDTYFLACHETSSKVDNLNCDLYLLGLEEIWESPRKLEKPDEEIELTK